MKNFPKFASFPLRTFTNMTSANEQPDSVTSEIFYEDSCCVNCGEDKDGYVVTKFHFRYPVDWPRQVPATTVDNDGDLVVQRRNQLLPEEGAISIQHSWRTSIRLVGLQVWRGALLLADWALHERGLLAGATVLELGAGTGITSIAAAMSASEVICTDVDIGGILDLIRTNASLNNNLRKGKFTVIGLDFFEDTWGPELERKLNDVSIILAADVVYDVDLTEAFVKTIVKILNFKPKKTLYFALEKRYVFTVDDLDSVAPIYEHFLSCLGSVKPSHWTVELVPIDFPQYFQYDRVKELVMWKIAS